MDQNLGELFLIARDYGRVRIHTMDDGGYYACIEFNTIDHTSLEAKSSFHEKTPEDAVRAAIVSARKIVDSILEMTRTIPVRKLIG